MKALVTGGGGFIGHHLVRELLEAGHQVAVIDNFSTGLRSRLNAVRDRIELIEGDIRDPEAMRVAARDCEVIFHEAALPSVARSVADPALSTSVNVDGTVQVMLAAADAGVRRVVFAGSSSVYGNTDELPRRESQRLDPRSPYAAGKAAAEYLVHSIGALRGVETVVLRYFNVFGPGQDPQSQYAAVVPRWVTAALTGARPIIFGDDSISRDFTYVENVASANLLAATASGVGGTTCNIACGKSHSLGQLLCAIADATGQELVAVHRAARPGDVAHSLADISVAERALGYQVLVSFEAGIRSTVDWYRAHLNPN